MIKNIRSSKKDTETNGSSSNHMAERKILRVPLQAEGPPREARNSVDFDKEVRTLGWTLAAPTGTSGYHGEPHSASPARRPQRF